jgi:hypothetical protein
MYDLLHLVEKCSSAFSGNFVMFLMKNELQNALDLLCLGLCLNFVFAATFDQSRCASALNETTVFWSCCKELQKRHFQINSCLFLFLFFNSI